MTIPTATYRLQFRNGMTFQRAIELIPHWQSLGISHVYASPIFAATAGSTHGYDIIDPNMVEPAIGGQDGFNQFSKALKEAGLCLILDIVPNHLAASLENPWWRSIMELGAESPYAGYFDVDWSKKLTLPMLSGSVESELEAGNIKLVIDAEQAALAIDYLGSLYPLHPATYRETLGSLDDPLSSDSVVLTDGRILDLQPWQFIGWRDAPDGLSYRRFFEITGLAGVRVEEPAVFDAVHRTVLDMVRRGQVDGLRIDHIDGLADPEAYLDRLRAAVGPDFYIVVEKILERDEQLPEKWPINGTTGYEFIASLADVLVDHRSTALDAAYRQISPESVDARGELRKAKQLMVDQNFRGEVLALQQLAREIADAEGGAFAADAIDTAVRSVLVAFPVYRTYGTPRGLDDADGEVLDRIFDGLLDVADSDQKTVLGFLHAVLEGLVGGDRAIHFRTRMQHLTGPLLAKALEDTFFYRYNRLIALNEVGGDPLARDGSVERFHARMQERQKRQPTGLTATSTHDTKRGEDTRARLYAISEAPAVWETAVAWWRNMHLHLIADLGDGPAPEPNIEWMLYQGLAGIWPPRIDTNDPAQLSALSERFLAFVEKALREAKQRTNWTDNNKAYEQAVAKYARHLLSIDNAEFLRDFNETLRPFIKAGGYNSLAQTLLKLTVPGVPDIYQGSEGLDLSLVDPDNRRIVDIEQVQSDTGIAADKQRLIKMVLRLRQAHRALFTEGRYLALEVQGPAAEHVIAFARVHQDDAAIVIAPRLVLGFVRNDAIRTAEIWRKTRVILPDVLKELSFQDSAGKAIDPENGGISLTAILAEQPFALLISPSKR
ncbi:MAG: treY [Rhizobium sp.]|nr:treY [Rhizobium sp.]